MPFTTSARPNSAGYKAVADAIDLSLPSLGGTEPVFPGFMYGSEAVSAGPGDSLISGWTNLITPGANGNEPADFALAESTMRYLVFTPPRADYDYRTFDFDRDPGLLDAWGKIANANNPDLYCASN